jgi:hypothetical protein
LWYDAFLMKKYIPYFICQISANFIWALWALPRMVEQGTALQIIPWFAMQILLPALLCLLLAKKKRYGYWLICAYGILMTLFGLGTAGWALMGIYTPAPVYVVCTLFLIAGFGATYQSLKDLNIGQDQRKYRYEDE